MAEFVIAPYANGRIASAARSRIERSAIRTIPYDGLRPSLNETDLRIAELMGTDPHSTFIIRRRTIVAAPVGRREG
jgi:hypothetical protein